MAWVNDILKYAKAARDRWGDAEIETTHGKMPIARVMLAIAGAEALWDRRAAGDSYESLMQEGYPQAAQEALTASCAGAHQTREQGCASYSSYQIFMPAHKAWLEKATGYDNPCYWAAWLCIVDNATEAAAAILETQGLGAWSTYTDGRWLNYLSQADAALAEVCQCKGCCCACS